MVGSKSRAIEAKEATSSQPFQMLEAQVTNFAMMFEQQLLKGCQILIVTGNHAVGVCEHLGSLGGIMKCWCQRHERVGVQRKLHHGIVSEVKMTHVMGDNKFSPVCGGGVEIFLGTEKTNF